LTSSSAEHPAPDPDDVRDRLRVVDSERLREDRALFERLADRGDPVDREILVERFLPLARSLAARYARPDEPFDDVFQVACMGLVKAIDRFDLSHDRAFSSFAVPTIAGEIKRYFRDKTWAIHVPRDLQELSLTVDRTARELERELARKPTVDELADRIGVTDEDVLEALHAAHARRATSLDAPHGDDDDRKGTLGETIAAPSGEFDRVDERVSLEHLTAILTSRERQALALRFTHDLTQEQIGEHIGVSQMQVSRILRQAIEKLRVYASQRAAANNGQVPAPSDRSGASDTGLSDGSRGGRVG
jgi:RNA polymerase sigma-B factor